ncbi:MAG: type IV secretory system conjugative DNA transfer family protein [Candidatus Liptonbacteria bacterium]
MLGFLLVVFFLVLGALLGVGGYFMYGRSKRQGIIRSLNQALLLIKVPKLKKEENQPEKDYFRFEINKFEQLISNLASMREPILFEVAVHHIGEEIHFYVSVPKKMVEIASKQIQSAWPGASVVQSNEDYNIFNPHGVTAAAYVKQRENAYLPIRTYQELESDTFGAILGAFAKVNEFGEGAAMQIVVRPADKNIRKSVQKIIDRLKRGESARKALNAFDIEWKDIKEAISTDTKEGEEKKEKVVDEDAVKALEAKISKPLFHANLRILASAPTQFQANDLLDGIISGFQQFSSPRRNEFKFIKVKDPQKVAYPFIFRKFDMGQAMIFSSEELASIYHFPIPHTDTPKVKWLKSKEAEPPADMPTEGTLIGHSNFRGESKPVYMLDDDRRRHVYTIGQTGTGKSTFLGHMIVEDIQKGRGVAIVDPHGELVHSIMGHIPKSRLDDVIYFEPGDIWHPLGLNMLDYNLDRPEEKTFIVNEMQSIFNKLFIAESMGPMFEQYMRNALLLLMEDMANEPATLIEVPRIFTDTEFRKRKLARITNPVVIDFWEKEAVKAGGEASLANMTPYITSKFNNFIANDYMRTIIGQPKSAFSFRQVMDEGKILLVNLSKGKIGDINANLLGMIMTGKILMAALSRTDQPDKSKCKDFYLYIDEFQNFTTDAIATILSEARKYKLNLIMAHQFIAQLEENIRDAVFGNVGTKIVFRVGVQDAEFLVKEFEPVFDMNDLVNIDNLNAYAKTLIKGQTTKPFNMKVETTIFDPGDKEFAEKIKEYSQLKYGADRQEVEKSIYERLRV